MGDRPWKGRRRRSCGGCCGSRDASRGRGSGQPDPGRADADGIRVMVAEVLGRPAVFVEPPAVLLEIRGVVLAGRRRGVEPGLAIEAHDVAADPVVVEVERHLRVGPDVVVAARVLLAVHEDLAVLPDEPDGHRLRLPSLRHGRQPADLVRRQALERVRALRVVWVDHPSSSSDGSVLDSSSITLPPITRPITASESPIASSASVRSAIPLASNGTGTAPSKSEPRATCSKPTTLTAWAMARAIAAGSRPHVAVGQKPTPTSPPVAAIPRSWSSARFRIDGHVPTKPVWEAMTGRAATATTSSIVRRDAWATSTSTDRASRRRTSSRPRRVRPILRSPCAEPAKALSTKCVSPTIR